MRPSSPLPWRSFYAACRGKAIRGMMAQIVGGHARHSGSSLPVESSESPMKLDGRE